MSSIKIDKGVPVPNSYAKKHKYPFPELEVGDSFFVATSPGKLSSQAWAMGKRLKRKFTVRAVEGGVRVWRIK